MNPGKKRRKAVVEERDCVACGRRVTVGPLGAIQVLHGITARVNPDKCVGCGKCVRECPASVIQLQEVEA